MKNLKVNTKYSSNIDTVSWLGKLINVLLIIGTIVFVILSISSGPLYLIGVAICAILLFSNYMTTAIISALSGIAKAAEYYMAIVETEHTIKAEDGDDERDEDDFVKRKKEQMHKVSLPYKEGDLVFCEPLDAVAVVLSINVDNTVTCGVKDNNGKMVIAGTFDCDHVSPAEQD